MSKSKQHSQFFSKSHAAAQTNVPYPDGSEISNAQF